MENLTKLELKKSEDIRHQLQKIKTAIAQANTMSSNGTKIDLAELQNSVQSVCNKINSSPRLISSDDLAPLIKTILRDFDALSKALANQHKILTTNGG